MKLIALLLLAAALTMCAAEADSSPDSNAGDTRITSQSVNFDLKTRQAVYHGDVHVADPRITLNCERLTATISDRGGRVDSLIAESNVVALIVTNDTVFTITAEKAIYNYEVLSTATNQTLELAGTPEPKITWPQPNSEPARTNVFTARKILWNIGTGNINAEGHSGVFPSVGTFDNPLKQINQAAPTNPAPSVPATNP